MDDLLDSTDATGLAQAIRSGEVAAVDVVEHAARRIERRDPGINAVVQRRLDEAVEEARAGVGDGPLAGVPFVIKDLGADVAGMASTQGSRLFADAVADRDSELVARYRRAGLIVMGKTNTPEFGKNASTEPLLYGPTRNPHALSRSPGGSSGGTAAAVSAGMVAAGHGSDGGGSLRIPASACGLIGLKPTRGRTPGSPDSGALSAPASVHHAITTSVRDCALLLDIAGGPLPGSGYAAPHAVPRYLDEVGADPGRCRIAVTTVRPDGVPANEQVIGPVEATARRLADLGHDVTGVAPAFPTEDLMAGFTMALSLPTVIEIDARLQELGRDLTEDDLEPFTRVLYDHGRSVSGADAIRGWQALERAGQSLGRFFSQHDILLTPTLAEPAPKLGHLDTTDVAAMYERAGVYSAFTSFCNATGQPAISLPLGHDEEGVPVGVQLVGAFGREDLLLRLASQLMDEPAP